MNTADRSVALIDDAIRRRFRFISKWPNFQVVLDDYNYDIQVEEISSELSPEMDMETALILLSIAGVEILNERILASADMQKGQQVGHTFLMNLHGIQEIVDCWRFEILPLIEEHYFGQFARIRDELFDGRGALLYDWDVEEIRSFDGPELVRALKQLVESSGRLTDGREGGGRGR
jgi:5-methylcytosine-specific restriction protein B